MRITITLFIILQILWISSLLISQKQIWIRRKFIIVFLTSAILIDLIWFIISAYFSSIFPLAFITLISSYQIFNLYRAYKSQRSSEHVRNITLSGGFKLWLIQFFLAFIILIIYFYIPNFNLVLALSVAAYVFGLMMFISAWRSYRVTSTRLSDDVMPATDLPTLSVLIPARNETDSLSECLNSILANDYPKLEVLVLDDASSNKRTPEIIRSFAHDGVIFIAGKQFSTNWLAKNWAYEQLLEASNGELVMYCGADTRFQPDALKFLISSLEKRNKQMLSVMPLNELPDKFSHWFLQPLRYAWEISLPRRFLKRPPVLATCWIARREFLINNGSFKGVSRRVAPESYFAKLATLSDGYSFFQYSSVYSHKYQSEQLETAIRLRYPQLRRQVESVMIASLVEFFTALSVIVLLCLSITDRNWTDLVLNLLAYLFYGLTFGTVTRLTYHKFHIISYLAWPLFFILDIFIMNRSMWRYELGDVLWKGRSIGPSVMKSF